MLLMWVSMTNTISTNDLRSLLRTKANVLLLDVLPRDKFAKDHIEGAHNIPMDTPDFVKAVERAAAGSKSKKVVVYCAGVECGSSERAAGQLTGAGFTDVLAYEGGLKAWRQESDDGATKSATPKVAALSVDKPRAAAVPAQKSQGKAATGATSAFGTEAEAGAEGGMNRPKPRDGGTSVSK